MYELLYIIIVKFRILEDKGKVSLCKSQITPSIYFELNDKIYDFNVLCSLVQTRILVNICFSIIDFSFTFLYEIMEVQNLLEWIIHIIKYKGSK